MHMNAEIGSLAEQFLFWEYLFRIFGIGSLQCVIFKALELEREDINFHCSHAGLQTYCSSTKIMATSKNLRTGMDSCQSSEE
jgi:hypothetical protein